MSEAEDRKLAANITRAVGAGLAGLISALGGTAVAAPIGLGIGLVAKLIEELGVSKAEEKLAELEANPAPLITKADLDAQTQSVIDELER